MCCLLSKGLTLTHLTVHGPHGLVLDLGALTTRPAPDDLSNTVRVITPPAQRLVDQVIAWLEQQAPAPKVERSSFLFRDSEALAATAVCLRRGSYFALLVDENRPLWPAATSTKGNVSRITNAEMWRLNLEVSSALATWLELRNGDRDRYERLVDAAVHWLPLEGKLRPLVGLRVGARALFSWLPGRPLDGWETQPVRALANALTLHAVRNGPIEDVHSGRHFPVPLEQRRLRPAETRRVVEQAASYLYGMLSACDVLCEQQVPEQPWLEQVGFIVSAAHSPQWSLTDDNRVTELDGPEPDPAERPWARHAPTLAAG